MRIGGRMLVSATRSSKIRLLLVLAFVCGAAASGSLADSYPSQRIRLLVPYPAGGGADFVARLIAPLLSQRLGQDVYVDNRGGAGGIIGAEIVARAPPDGYTIQLAASNLAWTVSLFKDLTFDPVKDFTAVSLLAETPSILAVNPALPVKSVKDLIALAQAEPGKINYAGGIGTSMQTDTELLKAMAHINLTQIPYRGTAPAVTATLRGEASVIIAPMTVLLPHIKSGSLRALAISTDQRVALLPDLPTVAESGVPGFDTFQWYGAFVPSRTPRNIVDRLNEAFVKVIREPSLAPRLASQAVIPVGDTPEQFAKFFSDEVAKWARVLKPAGMAAKAQP